MRSRSSTGEDTDYHGSPEEDRWLKIQATGHVMDGERHLMVAPQHVIAVSTLPGEGCEPANFGFCKYPASVPSPAGGKKLATKLKDWSWTSFCKTQYASDPKCGGVRTSCGVTYASSRCSTSSSKAAWSRLRSGTKATSGKSVTWKCWRKQFGDWNELIAGFVSDLRSAMEGKVTAPITGFPNFEHLEAKGLERLEELRRRLRRGE